MSGLENVGVAKEQDLLVTIVKGGRRPFANAYPALESVLSYSFFALLFICVGHVLQSVMFFGVVRTSLRGGKVFLLFLFFGCMSTPCVLSRFLLLFIQKNVMQSVLCSSPQI